ncbi:MAG TPA: neutral zinc metallopeptidase [Zoogloea sp.]|uniref:KPN_02809 family neutral zinc metallopeptidase n=1 Tax=Zoogloea sp. TaxID=49181 RepID=UPI002CC7399F|nr:neutral zinc metallopeptidase [Zoogloea sp.]HMV18494.1 neutral zinc metallopeptidase [Rhodocyclaceae bacterium]HMV63468.1 neutral zinc metallopeptidase [Rhodocyclaceae bacterium]HMW52070.1 neutral zinc metallopeptidase [Rhodocyclaceae bacterium]HMY49831.1 neutral zinc metallopeptidase [Rhodocyclaceae bacterium]HMZ76431.1 neutral zinc metallopeptidase [Rhodocyclaceae bacterium]
MRFDNSRESDNIEDRRGDGGGGGLPIGGRGIGLGTVVLALVAMYFGVDPRVVLNLAEQAPAPSAPAQHRAGPPANDPETVFVRHVLAETEDTWQTLFRQNGREYVDPKLVLFSGATRTACGTGQTAMGPFYCPADQKVYIDLAFYQELKSRFHAPGEFAQAYVIAHEVGHHVQNLLGISAKVQAARERAGEREANALSVRLELQADCLAGVWAKNADAARHIIEAGEVDQALRAASAIGDDTLQKQAQGYAVPDSFTHGSSEQRTRWFKRGMEAGDLAACNTFQAKTL